MVNPLIGFNVPNWAWDIIALILTFLFILILIRINDMLRKREIIPIFISRKVIHIFAGPIFLVCWLLFASDALSRYFAAVVPALFVFLFLAIGLGLIQNEEFVRTMSREGKARELLKGTLFYALVMVISSIFLWYAPVDFTYNPNFAIFIPTAFLIFGPLAGGDGFADLIGRRYGKHKFKIFAEKSVEGSLAMFFFSVIFTFGLLGIYWLIIDPIYASISILALIGPVFIVSAVTTIVEIFSPRHSDNILIPLAAIITIFALSWFGLYPYYIWHLFPLP